MIYFGFTIGPVVSTILQARKTRELWASSFIFSLFMRYLLKELRAYGDIIAPVITDLDKDTKHHGAGIWPDRCFLTVETTEQAKALQDALPSLIENALKFIDPYVGSGQINKLKQYFHCYACCFDAANDLFVPTPDDDTEKSLKTTHLFRLNKMLDDLEWQPKFQAQQEYKLLERLDDHITALYSVGFGEEDDVLRQWQHGKQAQMRVRSLIEIALQEFAKTEVYYNEVVLKIEEAIKNYRRNRKKDEEVAEEAIYQRLKSVLKEDLKSRHRYIAIVHADGDNIGKTIQSLQNDAGQIKAFSEALMAFSTSAVDTIYNYGALPVYAGGDDLLFIAPLQNDETKTIYDLLKSLRDQFSTIPLFEQYGASLSFGLSISYYKYPLGEAVSDSLGLLKYKAKNFCIEKDTKEKDALAVRLLTHSGHQLETIVWQKGQSFDLWLDLFKPSGQLEEAFLAGLMHKTEVLSLWLYDACRRGTLDAFFKAHFNEAAHSNKGKFIEKVKDLTAAIYQDYNFGKVQTDEEKKQLGSILHILLRLVQFQNAPDHD